jgi:adenylate cyclase
MRERLEEFNAERSKEGPTLRIRIGINSGSAVAGEIGSINKKEYTVLGDTVNIASRLESSVAQPMMIVVGENTFHAAKDEFDCRSLGRVTLKGKKNVVEAFEVLASLRVADAAPPPSAASREA